MENACLKLTHQHHHHHHHHQNTKSRYKYGPAAAEMKQSWERMEKRHVFKEKFNLVQLVI